MSRLKTALTNDYNALCFIRDELSLKASLLKAELKDRWKELEVDLDVLREHVGRAEVAAAGSRKELEASARTMLAAMHNGYTEIRNALKR